MFSVVRTTTGITNSDSAKRACPAGKMALLHHHQFVNKQADYDGRRGEQNVVHKAGGGGQFAALAEFGQKNAAQNADGRADQKAEERNHQAAQNGIAQAAFHARRRCVERENMRTQAAEAFIKQGVENPTQPEKAEGHCEPCHGEIEAAHQAAAAVNRVIHIALHQVFLEL
jgi:hypothetical protein